MGRTERMGPVAHRDLVGASVLIKPELLRSLALSPLRGGQIPDTIGAQIRPFRPVSGFAGLLLAYV